MSKNSRRRHSAKQHRAAARQRRLDSRRPSTDQSGHRIYGGRASERPGAGDDPLVDVSAACAQMEGVFGLVLRDGIWERGWQPDELVRHIRRQAWGTQRVVDLLVAAIAADVAHHDRVGNVIHTSWRQQVDRIVAQVSHDPVRPGWVERWLASASSGEDANLPSAARLLDEMISMPPLAKLIPPPGSSACDVPDHVETAAGSGANSNLARIRALLSKAESTEFPAEAEAFTAKAQALMSEARLDEATVRARSDPGSAGRVASVRIPIDEPYVSDKASLLHVVARANDSRSVLHTNLALATVVGPTSQLAHVELLFISLLIQVQSALAADAATAPSGSRTRSRRYRSSFIAGFTSRIGERLQAAHSAVIGHASGEVLPVLAADERATTELLDQLVGPTSHTRSQAVRDPLGVVAGVHAADRAALRDAGLENSATSPAGQLPSAGGR